MPDFMINAMAAGRFDLAQCPRQDGRYPYQPYDGPGHRLMQDSVRAEGRAPCYCDGGSEWVFFSVLGSPAPGVLELGEFRTSLKTETAVSEHMSVYGPVPPDWSSLHACPACGGPIEFLQGEGVPTREASCNTCHWIVVATMVPLPPK